MVTDDDKQIIYRSQQSTKLFHDLETAVRYAISEIDRRYLHDTVTIWLNLVIRSRRGYRVTPILRIETGLEDVTCITAEPSDIKLDMIDIYNQVTQRLTREHLTWDDVELDIFRENVRC